MITLTRSLARQVRAVFRRALGVTSRRFSCSVNLETGPEGLRIWAKTSDVAVQYHVVGALSPERITPPFQFLADCEGRKEEPVQLETQGENRATAQWRDGSVPQIVQYDQAAPEKDQLLPGLSETLAQNDRRLLRALHDASETADADAVRFATNHLRLRGKDGSIAATDGRQLLVQTGFTFLWENDVLIPRSAVFGCGDLPQDAPVAVGQRDDWVAFVIGPWTVWLAVNKTGRFPHLDHHVPRSADATARCRLSASDVQFLVESLPKLPCDDQYNLPVTLDLNGSVAVRAKGDGQARPTELVLSDSTWSGAPIRINSNRRFLARAMRMGFEELCIFTPQSPILCRGQERSYVWAVLAPDSALAPTDDAIRIVSTRTDAKPRTTSSQQERKTRAMPRSRNGTNGTAAAAQATEAAAATTNGNENTGLLEQARSLHEGLRGLLAKTGQLMLAVKQQEKRRRALQSTLASLRQLQTIEP